MIKRIKAHSYEIFWWLIWLLWLLILFSLSKNKTPISSEEITWDVATETNITWEVLIESWSSTTTSWELLYSYENFLKTKTDGNIYNIINKTIYSSFPSWSDKKALRTELTNTYGAYIQITNISHWYLYVIASVNNKPLGKADTVYMMFWNIDGKLDPVDSLKYWEEWWKSYFLYSLDKIKFIKYNTDIKRIWSRNLNIIWINSKLYWLWFVSTSWGGKLEKVQIIYK